jgi:hypothetical protein
MVGASFLSQIERYSLRIDHSEYVGQNLLQFSGPLPIDRLAQFADPLGVAANRLFMIQHLQKTYLL